MITAFVPARKGSERLRHKNMRQLAGVSLASLSVLQALDLEGVQQVVFSTDSERYAETVLGDIDSLGISHRQLKLHFRDAVSAGSKSKIVDVLRSLAENAFFDTEFVALMLPTAPLRLRSTARKVIKLATGQGQTSFTACPYDFHASFAFRPRPEAYDDQYWQPLLSDSPMVTGITRSQDQVQYLHPHGGFAIAQVSKLHRQDTIYDGAFPVSTTRTEGLDVDTSEDLNLARCFEESLRSNFPFMPEDDLEPPSKTILTPGFYA